MCLFYLLYPVSLFVKGSGGLNYANGVPTSLSQSGQQWDMPNAWPPLQHMLIEGRKQITRTNKRTHAHTLHTHTAT